MSKCDCSFKFKEQCEARVNIRFNGGVTFTKCDPDTCTIWQSYLRIESIYKKLGLEPKMSMMCLHDKCLRAAIDGSNYCEEHKKGV